MPGSKISGLTFWSALKPYAALRATIVLSTSFIGVVAMENITVMNETFSIEFSGKSFDSHEIPASALAQSLLALDGLAKKSAEALYGKDVSVELRVKAGFKQGSFIADLVAACHNDPATAVAVASGAATIAGGSVVGVIKGTIRLVKFLRGKKVSAVAANKETGKTQVTNEHGDTNYFDNCVVTIYNMNRVQSQLSRLTQTLDQEGTDSITITSSEDSESGEIITKEDRQFFRHEEGMVLTDNEAEVILEVVGPMINGSPKGWRFSDGEDGVEFVATVEDEEFLADVKARKIKFECGTSIRAVVRTVQRKNLHTITDRTIVEVKEVLPFTEEQEI